MLIGGQAVLLHGEPRLTQDVDITLGVTPERLPEVLDLCRDLNLELLPDDVAEFVRATFVLPVRHVQSGIRVDLVFSATPYERKAISRAVTVELGGSTVPFASAEDLVIHKLFAGRARDIEDVEGVLRRKGQDLDWGYVLKWVGSFAEIPGREGLLDLAMKLRDGVAGSGEEGVGRRE